MQSAKTKGVSYVMKEPREPLIHIVKRDNANALYRLIVRGLAVGVAFLIIFIFLSKVSGFSFSVVNNYMRLGAFATDYSIGALFKDSMLLLGIAVALAPTFKMRFWNIGAQGQVLMGGLLTATIMWYGARLGNGAVTILALIGGLLAGGIWALIPAFFKVKINANETLFTLMMNYVAIQLVACCVDIWKGKNSALPLINGGNRAGWLTPLFGNTYGAVYLAIAIITVFMFVYMRYTKHGYEISVVGESLNTARYAGINTKRVIMRTLFLSGVICGLCGFLYVSGVNHSIATTTGGSYGFTAIIVAWAAKFNPFAMALLAFIIVFLEKGTGGVCNYASNLNSYTAYIVVGIFLFLLIGSEFFINYKIVYNSKINAATARFKNAIKTKMPKTTAALIKVNNSVSAFSATVSEKTHNFIGKVVGVIETALSKLTHPYRVMLAKLRVKYKRSGFANNTERKREARRIRKENKNGNISNNGVAVEKACSCIENSSEPVKDTDKAAKLVDTDKAVKLKDTGEAVKRIEGEKLNTVGIDNATVKTARKAKEDEKND